MVCRRTFQRDRLAARRALVVVAVAGLLAGACAKGTPDSAPSPEPPRAPLTGQLLQGDALLSRPVLAIKIENSTDARPQSGLDQADVVVEEEVEGGITRFIALFHTNSVDEIGPVRSARLVDPDVLREYGTPLFAYSGAARYVREYIESSRAVIALAHGRFSEPFRRVSFRRSPHNLYTSTQALYDAAGDRGRPPASPVFRFGDLPAPVPTPTPTASPPEGASPVAPQHVRARTVTVDFSGSAFRAGWVFERESRRYLRSQGSQPHVMRDQTRIAAENVLVMLVESRIGEHLDSAGNPTPNTVVTGSGRAILFRDGVAFEGRWQRASIGARTRFTDEGGRPFVFKPGRTWIELLPSDKEISYR